eukprot:352621-Chlamydomonas_euryale.AAC.2
MHAYIARGAARARPPPPHTHRQTHHVFSQDAIPPNANSFELFGFDVMLDAAGRVWILEVNSSPSLGLSTPLDRETKPRVVRGLVQLVDPLAFDRGALLAVLDARRGAKGRRSRGGLMSGTVGDEREAMCADLQ